MITSISSASYLVASLSKPLLNAMTLLSLGAIFKLTESKKINTPSLEISESDKIESYKTLMQISQYFDDQKKGNIYDFSKLGFDPIKLLEKLGTPYNNGSEGNTRKDTNIFKNNPLIEYAVFHNLDLYKILDNCDFKSSPEITRKALTYKDINGLNLINHASRNRVALGDKLTARIVDIYVDNLDKESLIKSLDKFVLTLPPEQFQKIANKVGIENLQKIIGKKFNKKIINSEISKYHSPDIFPTLPDPSRDDLDGYDKATIVKGSTQDPLEIMRQVKAGNSVQISRNMMQEIEKNSKIKEELSLNSIRDKIYISQSSFYNGILATKHTFSKLSERDKQSFQEEFDISQSACENFLKNLKANQEYLASKLNPFSASRAKGKKPSSDPSSPEVSKQKSEQEL